LPSVQHGGFGVVTFTDTHVEAHRWVESRTIQEARVKWLPNHWTLWVPGNKDLEWLKDHASVKRPETGP
jgi:hypothetical protein